MATQEQRHAERTRAPDTELGRLVEKTLPFLEEHGNKLLLALAAILLVVALTIFMMRRSTATSAAGWTEMAAATSAGDYASIADRFHGTPVGNWARLVEGDSYLQSAVQLAFTDREASVGELQKATETYQRLLNDSAISSDVRERALFGMAQSLETGSDGNTEKSLAAYKTLLADFPNTSFKVVSEQRIDALSNAETKDFYAWFHQQKPKPSDFETPQDGAPGLPPMTTPELPMSLPEVPPLLKNVMPETTLGTEAEVDANGPSLPTVPAGIPAEPEATVPASPESSAEEQ